MTTIRQLASKYPQTTAKKLLSEFVRKFPEKTWTLDSEVPEGFTENFEKATQDYVEASGMELPKAQITTLPEALKDNKLILEAFEYGIVEAVAQLRTHELVQSAKLQALQDIQLTESAYNSVWEQYFDSKVESTRKRSEANNKQATEATINLNTELGKRQGILIRTQVSLSDYQKQNMESTDNAINALLK